jgi:two-component system OmpR family response regulator
MNILLLEDDETLSRNLVADLQEAGHEVDTCRSGQEAIELAASQDYRVLIFDRMVEGMDGLTALKALRAKGILTPALFLTAMTGVDDRVEGWRLAATIIWPSPFPRANCWRGCRRWAAARRRPRCRRCWPSATSRSTG